MIKIGRIAIEYRQIVVIQITNLVFKSAIMYNVIKYIRR